mgnify:CR=1 FL=1
MTEIDPKDDILGRARVRDNDELKEYYDELANIDTGAPVSYTHLTLPTKA